MFYRQFETCLSNQFRGTVINHFMKSTLEAVNLSKELFQDSGVDRAAF